MEAIKEEAVVSRGLFRIAGLVYGLAGERGQTGRLLSQSGTERGNIKKVWPFAQCAPVNGALKHHIGAGECLLV